MYFPDPLTQRSYQEVPTIIYKVPNQPIRNPVLPRKKVPKQMKLKNKKVPF